MTKNKVLITTLEPVSGGVPSMLKIIIEYLHQRNYQITLAYYSPYSMNPELSVPVLKLFQRRPSIKKDFFHGCDGVGVGCWLPELEFTHNWLTERWQNLIDQHTFHLTVSGSCLASYPYVQTKTPFWAWIATDWQGDREDRVKKFPLVRRFVDTTLIKPVAKWMEKKIIASGNVIALSSYTKSQLNKRCFDGAVNDILAMPIDTESFKPQSKNEKKYRIAFVGRFSDPRKNLNLLLESVAQVVEKIPLLEVYLIGDNLTLKQQEYSNELGIIEHLKIYDYMQRDALSKTLTTCDVFVLPSYQEGLCIAAMEAMSCGVPIVSTRCGGPEMFIENNVNGVLVDFNVTEMSAAILQLLTNDELRLGYSFQARKTIVEQYNKETQERTFWALFDQYAKTALL